MSITDDVFKQFHLTTNGKGRETIELVPLSTERLKLYRCQVSSKEKLWLDNNFLATFDPQDGDYQSAYRAGPSGRTISAYVAIREHPKRTEAVDVKSTYDDRYAVSYWAKMLFAGHYALSERVGLTSDQKHGLALGWGLGAYDFTKYRTKKVPKDMFLKLPQDIDAERLRRELAASYRVQDLINEPPNALTCEGLTSAAEELAGKHGASTKVIRDTQLMAQNYPLIYAVGKGSREEKPRLVDLRWGDESNPHVTLVGKGVTFDSGGYAIKPPDQMQTMKFDMAGAAHALGVAQMIMEANLPVRLRVLLPIVKNMACEKAYLPGEVYKTRLGPTMEIVNTDAEGRLLLFDALAEASHPGKSGGNRPSLIMAYGTIGWYGYTNYPGWASVIGDKLAVREEFQKAAAYCQEYVAPRPIPKDAVWVRDEILRQPASPADMVHASVNHGEYDDLFVTQLFDMAVERQKGEKGRQPDFVYVDIQPWRYPNSVRQQMPWGLPDGGFAQAVRSSYRMIEQRYE